MNEFLPLRTLRLLALVAGLASSAVAAPQQLWTAKLPGDAKWHNLTELGTLLVGTDSAMLSFDPDTGQQLWKRDDFKKTSAHNARQIPGTPFILSNNYAGIANSKVTLSAVDYLTGETVWQAPEIVGQYLATLPVVEKGLVIFIYNGHQEKDGQGLYFRAHDLLTGEQKWLTKFGKINAIPVHLADNSGKFMPTMDLSGYHDPVVDGDELYLGYLGVQCLDLNTGAIKWAVEFPPGDKNLKRTYAPLRIDGDRIYGAGGGSVYAIDRRTGTTIWKSDRISSYAGLLKARDNAIVSQLEIAGGKIFARYGGNFSNGQGVVLKDPLGIVVLNAADGEAVYQAKAVKEGLTNLMVLPEINTVMYADAYHLYGLDISAEQPVETFKVEIEFKRKMGGGEVAQLGLGVLGGVSGIVKAAKAQSKGRLDVPVAILRRGDHIIVQGKQHLIGFDPKARNIAWSTYYAAPGDTFGMTALFAVTAMAALQGNAMAAPHTYGSSGYRSGESLIHNSLDRYNKVAGKRRAATQGADDRTYVLTRVEEGKEKGIGLVGIRLDDGESDKQLILGSKEPVYSVDESIGRLFYFKGKDQIIAYGL
ncbi:hypothetical protein MASR2M8_21820 [Opitutaceae bacterium]